MLTCIVLKGHWRLFVLVSFFWLRVLDKAEYSAFESTLNSLSYRIVNGCAKLRCLHLYDARIAALKTTNQQQILESQNSAEF